ncbi:MAG: DUF3710 domain-containing protein [Rhodoluna sp.]|nr:DUF3710 domain-containing protein [Rhodoluna sp.]MBP6186219.1 DUF3710 domain-containing protein [Rhodoluna sp.]
MNDYSTSLGPFDSEQLEDVRPYIDFDSIRIEPKTDLSISVEVEDGSSRVVAVTLDFANSKLQLMAFAAPKTEGIWNDIRAAVAQNIVAQGGEVEEGYGAIGAELIAKLPLVDDQGRAAGHRLARFVGFDGPRWCLRGTVGGAAMTDPKAAADINDLFRAVIVHRGDTPLPPGEALPLSVPAGSVLPPGMKA